ncbi:Serine/threonine-protein kinase Nek2 [Orbilia ellipsospora]|uniref:Serine/threonine-protein kinase Nek2 n=1 Tax=Orbilia ellipsospora TaxID=2528407 RepID=A0AAV9X7J0_9PEZI
MALRNLTGKDPNYSFIASLGKGGFGSVAKVRRVSDGKIMACKALDCSLDPELIKLAGRELETWATFASSEKYIAAFSQDAAWNERTKTMRLYMKYYEGGDLQTVIDDCRHNDTVIHPFIATRWAMEIARGVKACHDHRIIHRDLKPANVLLELPYRFNEMLWAVSDGEILTDEQKALAKDFLKLLEERPVWCHITDFGLGKFSSAAHVSGRYTFASYLGVMGTLGFMAPETLGDSSKFSNKSDVYSLGCLIYSLCSGLSPPSTTLPRPGLPAGVPLIPEEYPKRMREIVAKCMQADHENRPNSLHVANEIGDAYMDILEDEKLGHMKTKLQNIISGVVGSPNLSSPKSSPKSSPNRDSKKDDVEAVAEHLERISLYQRKSQHELDNLLRDTLYRSNAQDMRDLIKAGANYDADAYDELGKEHSNFTAREPFSTEGLEAAQRIRSRSIGGNIQLLQYAVASNSGDCLRVLLENNAKFNVSSEFSNPLFRAVYGSHTEIVNQLLDEWGFDVNASTARGDTLIQWAFRYSDLRVTQKLLTRNPNLRIKDNSGLTLWHTLVDKGFARGINSEIFLELYDILTHSIPDLINTPSKSGETPLHRALLITARNFRDNVHSSADMELIACLCASGADPYIKNSMGEDAFGYTALLKDNDKQEYSVVVEAFPKLKTILLSQNGVNPWLARRPRTT